MSSTPKPATNFVLYHYVQLLMTKDKLINPHFSQGASAAAAAAASASKAGNGSGGGGGGGPPRGRNGSSNLIGGSRSNLLLPTQCPSSSNLHSVGGGGGGSSGSNHALVLGSSGGCGCGGSHCCGGGGSRSNSMFGCGHGCGHQGCAESRGSCCGGGCGGTTTSCPHHDHGTGGHNGPDHQMMHFARIIRLYYMAMRHDPLYACLRLLYEQTGMNPNKSALCNVIRELCFKPRTLKQIARVVIYNSVGQRPALVVNKLPLPSALKEYLLNFEP